MPQETEPFVKYGKLVALAESADIQSYSNRKFSVFEKIDGGNCQVRKVAEGRLVAGSKANFLHGSYLRKREWFERLNGWMHSNYSLYNLPQDIIMFGEWSGNHTIEYAPEHTNKFFLIDLFDVNLNCFTPYRESCERLSSLGIEDVAFTTELARGKITERDIERLLDQPSQYYNGPKEGLVLKDYTSSQQLFLKIYHSEFSEKIRNLRGEVFYLTPARYRKNIYRLIEERGYAKLTSGQLVEGVQEDVRQEEGVIVEDDAILQLFMKYRESGKLLRASRFLAA